MERLEGPAEVRAYQSVFRYRHLGRGRPILLLPSPEGSWRMAGALLDGLAGHFRVMVPNLEGAGADPGGWLTCFLDGLGVRAVGLVAAGFFGASIADLLARDPGQVGRVVFVVDGAPGRSASVAAFAQVSARVDVPILQVREDDLEVPSTLIRLVDFLDERSLALPLDRPRRGL